MRGEALLLRLLLWLLLRWNRVRLGLEFRAVSRLQASRRVVVPLDLGLGLVIHTLALRFGLAIQSGLNLRCRLVRRVLAIVHVMWLACCHGNRVASAHVLVGGNWLRGLALAGRMLDIG
jgi:hypothetical protein